MGVLDWLQDDGIMSSFSSEEPRNARIIGVMLQSLGVEEWEPRVHHQLNEFLHRYLSDVFQDATMVAQHANVGNPDLTVEDIRLAIQAKVNHSFTAPPPREFMAEIAAQRNKNPLPLVVDKFGIRLPPDRHCLTAVSYQNIRSKRRNITASPKLSGPAPKSNEGSVTGGSSAGGIALSTMDVPAATPRRRLSEDDEYDDDKPDPKKTKLQS
eukprot:Lithocolla_globosa_v1_NODE_4347_length_1456_cov_63.894361.p1 type:complete len:211 gc:universal NODE_4347_length_1456_cov_63.894361:45-677(+)